MGMIQEGRFGNSRLLETSFEDALARTKAALKEQGFGVLAEIDMAKALKEKIGAEIPAHTILGACNPPLAFKAVGAEPDIGLFLPCNVVVRQVEGGMLVSAIDAEKMMASIGNPALAEVAVAANERLKKALEAL